MNESYVTLGQVCDKGSSNIAQKDLAEREGQYPIYGATGLIKSVDFAHQKQPYIAIVKDGAGIGRVMKLPAYSSVIGTMQYIFPKKNVDIDYLFYALQYMNLGKYFSGSTIPHIYFRDYQKERLKLPAMKVQRCQAETLSQIDTLLSYTQRQIVLLDELVKSRFIELFGDYDLTHPQESWVTIKEIGTVVGGATPKTDHDEYWGGSHRWITPAELDADSVYIYDSVRKLTKAGVESCSLQEMPVGTVILSSRAPIGKVAIAGNTFYCNQGFKNIICKEGITPRYLYTVLLLNVEYLNSLGRGATFKEISKGIVESIRIPVPSMDLQQQFAAFVEQVDKSKFEIQKSIEKLEILKKSLMQKYFG